MSGPAPAPPCFALPRDLPSCRLVGIELQRELLRVANTNIEANGLAQRAEMIASDLATLPPRLMAASFDHVMTNPPFLTADAATPPPLRQRADAHVESHLDLAGWLKSSLLMLKNGGSLTLIHRADRLGELLAALDRKVGDIVVYPLWPKDDGRPAKRILIQGWKGAKGPLKLARKAWSFTKPTAAIARPPTTSCAPARPCRFVRLGRVAGGAILRFGREGLGRA